MKQHRGMRPQDPVLLLAMGVISKQNPDWQMKDLAQSIGLSGGEVSESLKRSQLSGLVGENKRKLRVTAFLEFLRFGLPYVFPGILGPEVRGLATAYSAPPLNQQIASKHGIVWPWDQGNVRGWALEPLYAPVVERLTTQPLLYEVLALTEVFRVGRNREKAIALEELEERLKP